jgi:hypothetical protein
VLIIICSFFVSDFEIRGVDGVEGVWVVVLVEGKEVSRGGRGGGTAARAYFKMWPICGQDVANGHGLSKVSLVPYMPYPSMLCRQPPLTAVSRVLAPRVGGLWPSSTPLDTPRRTPLTQLEKEEEELVAVLEGMLA